MIHVKHMKHLVCAQLAQPGCYDRHHPTSLKPCWLCLFSIYLCVLVVHACVYRGMWRPRVNAEYLSRSAPSYLLRQDIS